MVAIVRPNEFDPPPGGRPTYAVITVVDLRNGRVLHRAATELGSCNSRTACDERPDPVLLKENGSVAWAVSTENVAGGVFTEILAADTAGLHLLARTAGFPGTAIDRRSLTLTGSMLSWVQGGERKFALLN
jgi:hypothetical protein